MPICSEMLTGHLPDPAGQRERRPCSGGAAGAQLRRPAHTLRADQRLEVAPAAAMWLPQRPSASTSHSYRQLILDRAFSGTAQLDKAHLAVVGALAVYDQSATLDLCVQHRPRVHRGLYCFVVPHHVYSAPRRSVHGLQARPGRGQLRTAG
ncbi:MAG: hypothetical protein ACRDSZ_15450, partial [Pseudonocardiaceae bacterium]